WTCPLTSLIYREQCYEQHRLRFCARFFGNLRIAATAAPLADDHRDHRHYPVRLPRGLRANEAALQDHEAGRERPDVHPELPGIGQRRPESRLTAGRRTR